MLFGYYLGVIYVRCYLCFILLLYCVSIISGCSMRVMLDRCYRVAFGCYVGALCYFGVMWSYVCVLRVWYELIRILCYLFVMWG